MSRTREEQKERQSQKRRICLFKVEPSSRAISVDDLRKSAEVTPERRAAGTGAEGGPTKVKSG